MNLLISIIIPVYNVENYLKRCLDSVLIQENCTYEMILVDDGSKDESGKICDDYQQKHPELIKVIHKENEGLGYARNTGIDAAKGDYIFFLDSDDMIPEGTLQYLTGVVSEYNPDIISFHTEMLRPSSPDIQSFGTGEIKVLDDKPAIIEKYMYREIGNTAWSKLYRKKIFDKERFSNVRLHEDTYSMPFFLDAADRVVMADRLCYIQYLREGSLMTSKFTKNNLIDIECSRRFLNYVTSRTELEQFTSHAYAMLIYTQVKVLVDMLRDKVYDEFSDDFKKAIADIREEIPKADLSKLDSDTLMQMRSLLIGKNACETYVFIHNSYLKIRHRIALIVKGKN